MKNPLLSRSALSPLTRSSLIACASLCAITHSAFAASQSWVASPTDANWATGANWSGSGAPGTAAGGYNNGSRNNDIATFNTAVGTIGTPGNPIQTDPNRFLKGITFDTANAGSHSIGVTGGNQLQLDQFGLIQMNANVVNPQTVNADIRVRFTSSQNYNYTLKNDATSTAATLTIGGVLQIASSTGRGVNWILDGANTGDNLFNGSFSTSAGAGSGGFTPLTKTGSGTWRVTGTNALASVAVNSGLLVSGGAAALGTGPIAVSGGTLSFNNFTLGNSVVNLSGTGAIKGAGAASVAKIAVSAAALGNVTLSADSASDTLNIGTAANDFSGGASDTVVHIAGLGTVTQNVASNYAGTWSLDSGTLNLGSPSALGALGSVSIANGAKLQTMGNNIALTSFTGAGAVANGVAGPSTLTANIASSNTFAGSLQDGAAGGALAFTKTGAGTLNLSGASTYTGATTVTTGTLNLTGSLGNTAATFPANTIFSGTGTVAGSVSVVSGAHLAPGDGGDANIGTITTGTLSLDSGSLLDFGLTSPASADKVTVTTNGGLTINGGQININGGSAPFTTIGTYNLIGYSGAIDGGGVGSLTINESNKSATRTYTLAATGSFITLTVADSGIVARYWNVNANGNWGTAASWTPVAIPNAVGAYVGFGGGGIPITDNRTVTVNGSFTVGTLAFTDAPNGKSYTLAAGSGANLNLDNGANAAFVTVTSGNHTIDSPLVLAGNGATFTVSNAANTLTVGGVIDGNSAPLVKGGAGTLALNAVNTYVSGTTLNGGTVLINNPNSLGDAVGTTVINAATLRPSTSFTSSRSFQLGDGASTISVPTGVTYTIDGNISDSFFSVGTLNKSDTGTLVLNASNSYSGGTVINAGTVQINGATSLGSTSGTLTLNDAVLQPTLTFTGSRNVILGHANSTIFADTGVTYTISGAISGSGVLNKTGAGTVSLGSNANSYTGGTVIHAGILAVNNGSFLGGTLTFQGGTLQNNYGNNNSYFFGTPVSVPTGQTGTINMGNRMSLGGGATVTGAGTLNVNINTNTARDDFSNNWAAFTGQLNIAGTGTVRLLNNGGGFNPNSFANASVDLAGTVLLEPSNYSGNNTYNIGALSGASATAGIKGPAQGGATILSVGALNTTTTFAGQTLVAHLTKVGTGTLSLTGTAPTGNVTVTAGTLSLGTNNLSDTSTVNIGTNGTLNLNFSGQDVVTSLIIGPDTKANGIYGAPGSNAQFEDPHIIGTGFIKVGADPFGDWIDDFAVNGKTAKTDDPDGDGLTNLDEFALNGDPAVGGVSGKVRSRIETVGSDQVLVITLPVRTGANFGSSPFKTATFDDIIYTIQGSNDLNLFDQGVTEIAVRSADMPILDAGWTYHTFRLDGAIGGATPRGPKGFLRAKIEDAP